jgi:hypothetical protein
VGEPGQRLDDGIVSPFSTLCVVPALTAPAYSDPREYLRHVMKATNMSCLTPEGAISGECDFLSANMYARSLFGAYLAIYLVVTKVG